jgi:S1-C subfamily serine protease
MEGLNPELSEFFGGLESGVLILRVLPQTPAAELGLRPGDVIVEAGGRAVSRVGELRSALQEAGQGAIEVKWVRKGTEITGHLQR